MDAAIAQFLDYLTLERGLSQNTRDSYGRDLADLSSFLGNRGISSPDAVRRDDLQDYLADLKFREMAPATCARRLIAIKVFFAYLATEGFIQTDIADVLTSPKQGLKLPFVVSEDEIVALLAAPSGNDPIDIRDRAILETFYACGLRVSELAMLRLDDVHLDSRYLRCLGKGDKQRIVPLGSAAIQAIEQYLDEVRPKFLLEKPDVPEIFLTRRGERFSRQGLWKMIVQRAQEAGLGGKIHPHTLRHCFATHLLEHGAQLRVIQEMLGHANVETTQIYTHVDGKRLIDTHRLFHPRSTTPS